MKVRVVAVLEKDRGTKTGRILTSGSYHRPAIRASPGMLIMIIMIMESTRLNL